MMMINDNDDDDDDEYCTIPDQEHLKRKTLKLSVQQ